MLAYAIFHTYKQLLIFKCKIGASVWDPDNLLLGLGLKKLLVCPASVWSAVDPDEQLIPFHLQLGAVRLHEGNTRAFYA